MDETRVVVSPKQGEAARETGVASRRSRLTHTVGLLRVRSTYPLQQLCAPTRSPRGRARWLLSDVPERPPGEPSRLALLVPHGRTLKADQSVSQDVRVQTLRHAESRTCAAESFARRTAARAHSRRAGGLHEETSQCL